MASPIGGGAFDFTLVVERRLMNEENASTAVRDDPGSPAAEDLEAIFEPRDLWQRRPGESYDEFSLGVQGVYSDE